MVNATDSLVSPITFSWLTILKHTKRGDQFRTCSCLSLMCFNMVGALRFELRRPETTDLQSAPDTVTGLDTQILPYQSVIYQFVTM